MARELTDDEVFGSAEQSDEDVFGAPSPNRRKSFSLGFVKGASTPLMNTSKASFLPESAQAKQVRAGAERDLRGYIARRERTEKPSLAGEVTGNVLATAPAAAVTRNPFIGGMIQGGMSSESDNLFGRAGDTLMGGILGHYGGKAVEGAAGLIKPVVEPAVRRMKDAGVHLTPGMAKGGKAMDREDKAMSRPFVGDAIAAGRQKTQATFNTASVNEAIAPLGVKVPSPIKPGHDSVAWAHKEVGQAYDTVVPNLSVKVDGQKFAARLTPMAATLEPAQQQQLQKIVSATLKNGQLSGRALKDAQGELRRLAGVYSRDAAAPNRELGRVLSEADDELTQTMMAQNPQWAPQLQKVNTAYRGLKIIEDAASRADDGLINTGQLKQSVRRGDFSKGKSKTAQGEAHMQDFSEAARSVIPARAPNPSGTAAHMMSGNLFANARGLADLAGYRGDEAVTRLMFAPRPKGAGAAARNVRRLRRPAAAGVVAASEQTRD